MAARRLVIVMLVLLGISTLAAALIPTPDRSGPSTDSTDTIASLPEQPQPSQAAGRLVSRKIRIDDKPAIVRVHPGDELRLTVSGPFADDIEIPAFGLTTTMTPYAPATFDVIVPEAGSFAIRAVQTGRPVGRIDSQPPGKACEPKSPAPAERARPEACGRRGGQQGQPGGRSGRRPSGAEDRQRR
jgi:hypothetical protein